MSAESRVVAIQPQMARDVQVMTSQALLERRDIVQRVIAEVMVEGLHYGIIPGTREISLLKEGAEVLLATFHIAVEPVVTDQSTPTEVRFQVECRGLAGGQVYVGSGIGVCSSNEEKYRWRASKSAKEYENASPEHRRIKYGKDFETRQVRQSPWDVFQTIMSMAKKRGMVDLAKTALAASECLKKAKLKRPTPPAGNREATPPSQEGGGSPTAAPASSKSAGTAPQGENARDKPGPATSKTPALIDPLQARELADRLDAIGIPENAFLARFELGRIEDLPSASFPAAQSWITANES